jgi:hypothetical protein
MTDPPRITPFHRGLQDELFDWLQTGLGKDLVDLFKDRKLDVRLRDNYLNAYQAQCSLARLQWARGKGASLAIHKAYLQGSPLARLPNLNREHNPYARFAVTPELVDKYAKALPAIKKLVAADYVKPEGEWEEDCCNANLQGTSLLVIDRQIVSGKPAARLDLLAIGGSDSDPFMVAVEMKRDVDNRIQEVPEQTAKYLRMLDPDGDGLREEVADSYRDVCRQLRVLGFEAPDPDLVRANMPVKGLVAIANYNDKSELLRRAFEQALRLDRDIRFCRISGTDLVLPPEEKWISPQEGLDQISN